MSNIPVKPNLKGQHSQAHRVLDERVLRGIGLMRAGAGILIEWDGEEYVITSTARNSAIGGHIRGEYDPTASYAVDDIVVIRSGANAGSYGCIQANTGSAPITPDIGNLYWISLSGNGSNWMT